MKKQQQQRKKWEEQISDEDIPPELFKIPIVEAAEEPPEQQTENKQTKQTGPAKKQKEFAWMSDDDELEPDNRPSTSEQPAAQTGQQPKRGQRQQQEDLFITNIPLKAKEEDLQSYLTKFGKVQEIYMPMNEGTSVHKGKAFVKMIIHDEQFARKEHRLKGQQIHIKIGGVVAKEPEPARSRSRSRSR